MAYTEITSLHYTQLCKSVTWPCIRADPCSNLGQVTDCFRLPFRVFHVDLSWLSSHSVKRHIKLFHWFRGHCRQNVDITGVFSTRLFVCRLYGTCALVCQATLKGRLWSFSEFHEIQSVFKKKSEICYKDFILQHFKHCSLQSSPLYWRYTIPNVSSIVGMLPGTHFLWWRAVLLSNFPEFPRVQKNTELFK
jgi:hypothetical protein